MWRWALLITVLAALATGASALAAQDSTVVVDNAPIRLDPKSSAKVLEYLPVGTEVRVSSYPLTGGWYKIRSKTGAYGWINETFLSVYKPKAEEGKEDVPVGPRPERDRKWFLRGIGGFDFFRPDELNSLYGISDLNTGYYLGGELGVFLSDRVAFLFRTEAIMKDITIMENQSGINFNLALRSYPTMLGFDFFITKLPAMRLSFGIFGGVALSTSFSEQASALPQPNVVVLQGSPFTTLARFNLTRPLGRILSVCMEVGYRYLRTSEIDTSSAAGISGGPQIFGQNGTYTARAIDLSGILVGVGLGLHF